MVDGQIVISAQASVDSTVFVTKTNLDSVKANRAYVGAGGGSETPFGALVAHVFVSKTMTNIGTNYVDIYASAFDEENMAIVDFKNADSVKIVWIWDYIGAGTQRVRWVDVGDNTNVLYESATFTADQDGIDSGWFVIPAAFAGVKKTLEWQGKSTTSTDDPVGKGYVIYLK